MRKDAVEWGYPDRDGWLGVGWLGGFPPFWVRCEHSKWLSYTNETFVCRRSWRHRGKCWWKKVKVSD